MVCMEVLQTAQYLNGYDSMQALVRAVIEGCAAPRNWSSSCVDDEPVKPVFGVRSPGYDATNTVASKGSVATKTATKSVL